MAEKSNASIFKTYLVVLGVCLFGSFLVSISVVKLAPLQKANQQLEKIKNILVVADLYTENADINAVYHKNIDKQWIELATGKIMDKSPSYSDKSSIVALAKDPAYGEAIPEEFDIAKIKRRPKFMPVYFVKNSNKLQKIILPIYGKGLWSTLYGFLALDSDAKTISGITFYEQGETPGLGGEITNPRWQTLWQGKQAFDDQGRVAIRIIKGEVVAGSPEAKYQIDGIAGATLTSRGVNNLVRYWLGNHGFGPFLNKFRREDHD